MTRPSAREAGTWLRQGNNSTTACAGATDKGA